MLTTLYGDPALNCPLSHLGNADHVATVMVTYMGFVSCQNCGNRFEVSRRPYLSTRMMVDEASYTGWVIDSEGCVMCASCKRRHDETI